MEGVILLMVQRMTWEEICTKYPNQRVLIEEPEWVNASTIKSGIVKLAESDGYSRGDIRGMALISDGKLYCESISPEGNYIGIC